MLYKYGASYYKSHFELSSIGMRNLLPEGEIADVGKFFRCVCMGHISSLNASEIDANRTYSRIESSLGGAMAGVAWQLSGSFVQNPLRCGHNQHKYASSGRLLTAVPPPFSRRRSANQLSGFLITCNAVSSFGGASAALEGDPVKEWIFGEGGATKIKKTTPVGGGCVNTALRYDTDAGSFFVKTNRDVGSAMFEAEAIGLNAMFATGTIRVPKPHKVGNLPGRGSYIIMEHISLGSSRSGQAELGRQLGEMHKTGKSERGFGFDMDNTIGSTQQPNPWTSDWITFFRDHRLGFQLHLAGKQYRDSDICEKGKRLMDKLPSLFRGVNIAPCLLHGDLWSGNVSADENGSPVILDPACYYGHNEAEFGMSWCAGFSSSFYDAYFKVMPKQPGYEQRRDLYRLYHYLNHYNLFGSSYRSSAMSIIQTYNNQS